MWVTCPVQDTVAQGGPQSFSASVTAANWTTSGTITCYLHRVSASTARVVATTSLTIGPNQTTPTTVQFNMPTVQSGLTYYGIECVLPVEDAGGPAILYGYGLSANE
jgi:hypothetical protein